MTSGLAWLNSAIALAASPRMPLAICIALSVLGWRMLPSLSAKWLAQVVTLSVCAVAELAGWIIWYRSSLAPLLVWANLIWATITSIVILTSYRRHQLARPGPGATGHDDLR